MRDVKFAVVDVETTGLDLRKDEVISVAILPMDGLKILVGSAYHTFVRPKSFRVSSIKYHGITPEILENAPSFCEVSGEIMEKIDDRVLVGHGVSIDVEFLQKEFGRCGKKVRFEKSLDIALVERVIGEIFGERPSREELTLESLARKYNVPLVYRHSAMADAYIEAQIFQIQMMRLMKYGINSLSALESFISRLGISDSHFIF
ncbi:MAG: 3'-5' exonuclease [Archaeoglobi archaeon]|nr:3'-5' exonuclease [Archaeoglobi archaeon]